MMIENNFCRLSEQMKNDIRIKFNVSNASLERDIGIMREWIKQQKHLPQNQDDDFLENSLLRNKFRIEQTKEKLEKYYALKWRHLDIFRNIPTPPPSKTSDVLVPLPYLTDQLERIVILKLNKSLSGGSSGPETDDVMPFLKYVMCTAEYSMRCDFSIGHRWIQDFQGFTLNHIARYSAKVTAYASAYQDAYFNRVAGIEYINVPPFLDVFMQGTRLLMKPKVFKKITIHKNLESLYQNVNRKYLPSDYGGDQKSLNEFLADWNEEFVKNRECLENIVINEVSAEPERIKGNDRQANEVFGVNGTFKALNFD